MQTLVKKNIKLFFKTLYLSAGTLILFIVINIYLIEGMYRFAIHKNALYYLQQSQYISIICFIFFIFISYEYLIKSRNENVLEGISAMDKGKINCYFSQFIVLIIIISIMTLNIMIYNYIIYFISNVKSLSYAGHIFLSIFLNIILISCLGMCTGAIASIYLKRFSAYSLLIIITFLISPLSDFIASVFNNGFGINLHPLREIFNILPPNLEWYEEPLYGLSIEPYRWNLMAFWMFLLFSLILIKLKTIKTKRTNFIVIILLFLSLGNFYFYTKPGSIVRKGHNPKDYVNFDQVYYMDNLQKEEDVNFNISGYDMNIVIDRKLNNDVRIFLDEKEPLDSYKFTLYRNYKIEKVVNKENEVLEFKRDGDYLEVFNPSNEKLGDIRVLYSGYSPVFYSNTQGVLLPGCFPYYPMGGYRKIYSSGYIPIIGEEDIEFNVTVKANLDIYSNLERKEDKLYGNSQAMTLIGGFVEEKSIGDNILYSLFLNELNTDALFNIDDILLPYKNMFFEDKNFETADKKIFQAPDTIAHNIIGGDVISFRDHILIYDLSEKESLIHGFLQSTIPQNIEKVEVKIIFFEYLLHKDNFLNIPKEELEEGKPFELYGLFLERVDKLGEDYVLKTTYDFLKDKKDKRNSKTFIKDLGKGEV